MLTYRPLKPMLLSLAILAGSVPAAMAAGPDAATASASPSPQPARVWFLRPSSFNIAVAGADPMIYANGAPLAAIPANASFYRDLAPGSYRFTVQPYGVPTGQADTVQLTPGSQTYLEVQWVPTWEEGYASGGRGDQSHSFSVLNMSPQLAQAYLPSLTYLGQ